MYFSIDDGGLSGFRCGRMTARTLPLCLVSKATPGMARDQFIGKGDTEGALQLRHGMVSSVHCTVPMLKAT
jgi:hypothetical protein